MKTFCHVACGFTVEGTTVTLVSPSTGIPHLRTQLDRGNGAATVAALEGPAAHATDSRGFNVIMIDYELTWVMRGDGWEHTVIVPERLAASLLAELRKL